MKSEQQIKYEIENLQKMLEYKRIEDTFLNDAKFLEGKYFLEKSYEQNISKKTFKVAITYIDKIEEYDAFNWQFVGRGHQATFYCNPPVIYKDSRKTKSFFGDVHVVGNTYTDLIRFEGAFRGEHNAVKFREGCKEITANEFKLLMSNYLDAQNKIYNSLQDLFELPTIEDKEVIPVNLEELLTFDNIDKLLKEGVKLIDIKPRYHSKINNFFNYKNELETLSQFELKGNKEINLTIKSYGGETDYEPYTTDYVIQKVSVSWPDILYPIRNKLTCGVLELTEKLKLHHEVYSTRNWKVSVASTDYGDVEFLHASLEKSTLKEVNLIISKHLK